MDFVVIYNAETDAATIIKPSYAERINLMLADDIPTLADLHEFYLLHNETAARNTKILAREDEDFLELLQYCKDVSLECNYDRCTDERVNSALYKKLRQLLHIYYCVRSGRERCLSMFPADFILNSHVWAYKDIKRKRIIYMLYGNHSRFREAIRVFPESVVTNEVHGGTEPAEDQAGNVVLTVQHAESNVQTAAPSMKWSQFSSNDVVDDYATLVDRWYTFIPHFEWNTTQSVGDIIVQVPYNDRKQKRTPILPYDAIWNSDDNTCDVPNLVPFRVHAYWRGDMEVKIQVNSNKFQIGQLQISFYHQADLNKNIDDKTNVWTLSQLEHALVNASDSNSVVLRIPYKHAYPLLPCQPSVGIDSINSVLNLGRLYVKVLNPLKTITNGPDRCGGCIMIRFINSEFCGMKHGSYFVKPEMDLFTMAGAMKLLDTVMPDTNRDLPPVNIAPAYVVPTASHTWAHGNGQAHPIHSLRLDSRGQTHHPPACDSTDVPTIDNMVSHYGLITQLEWSIQNPAGMCLDLFPATPFQGKQVHNNGYKSKYAIAPVGVIASMFKQWRGSLEFKFEIVASQYHTGRLMIGYVPGYCDDCSHASSAKMTLKKLRSSPHIVFDLQETSSFTYEIPYISYKPWWPRQNGTDFAGTRAPAPSYIFIYVLNPLVVMDSVPEMVYLNVYLRGSPSFECSIPVQPAYGLTWHTKFAFNADEILTAVKGYAPYYPGFWHSFCEGSQLIMRWGTVSDQIAEFNTPHESDVGAEVQGIYYEFETMQDAPHYKDSYGNMVVIKYLVVAKHTSGFYIGVPTDTELKARSAASRIFTGKININDVKLKPYWITVNTTSSNTYSKGNPSLLKRSVYSVKPETVTKLSPVESDYVLVRPEGEEQNNVVTLSTNRKLARTNHGQYFYGENFNDLKNYMRRYQFAGQIPLTEHMDKDASKCAFYFPALPQGLELDVGKDGDVNELSNRCREGYIPLFSSAFRYYRGSLRYRLIMPKEVNMMVWVQHRPDRPYSSRKIIACNTIETSQSVFNHSYGSYIQFCQVNNIIEFEVPFYNDSCYNWLQNPIDNLDDGYKLAITLGEIAVGVQVSQKDFELIQNKLVTIYYAIADDMAFTHWVGFPLLYKLESIPERTPRYTQRNSPVIVQPEMMSILSPLTDKVETRAKEVAKEMAAEMREDTVNDIKKGVGEMVHDLIDSVQAAHRSVDPGTIATVVSQLGHIALNPTISTVAWSLASVIIAIGLFACSSLKLVYDAAVIFATKWLPSIAQPTTQPDIPPAEAVNVQPEAPQLNEEDEETTQWLGVLWMGISSTLGFVARKPHSMNDWYKTATQDLGNSLKTSNAFMTFLRNTFNVLRKMFNYILGRVDSSYALCQHLQSHPEMFKLWAEEVCFLTDPLSKRKFTGNIAYSNRVYEAVSFGQLIVSDVAGELKTEKNTAILMKLYDKIALLREELMTIGQNPYVRKLPFTIYMYGPPGIGKSHLSTQLCAALLKSANIKIGNAGMKCTINPQSDFWDQCEHQPVLEIDDIFAVSTPTALEKQLCTLFQVCSPIVLSPPKAALEDKKMRYNPEIFYLNSNKDFPKYNNVSDEAIWRRRDVLIEARLSPTLGLRKGCPHCDPDILKKSNQVVTTLGLMAEKPFDALDQINPAFLSDYHHLEFRFHSNPRDAGASWGEWINYQQLESQMISKFRANREREHYNFINRVRLCEGVETGFSPTSVDTLEAAYEKFKHERLRKYEELATQTFANDAKKLWEGMKLKPVKDAVVDSYTRLIKQPVLSTFNALSWYHPEEQKKRDHVNDLTKMRLAAQKSYDKEVVRQYVVEGIKAPKLTNSLRAELTIPPSTSHKYTDFMSVDCETLLWDNQYDSDDEQVLPFTAAEAIMTRAEAGEVEIVGYNEDGIKTLYNHELISQAICNKVKETCDLIGDDGDKLTEWIKFHKSVFDHNAIKGVPGINNMHDLFRVVMRSKESPHFCSHESVNLRNIDYLDGKLRSLSATHDWQTQCDKQCIFESPFLKYVWYSLWLRENPTIALRVRRKKFECVPRYFTVGEQMALFDASSWYDGLVLYLQHYWEKGVKPIFRTLHKWLTKYIPEILVGLTSIAALFVPGLAIYNRFLAPTKAIEAPPSIPAIHDTNVPPAWSESESLRYDYQKPMRTVQPRTATPFARPQTTARIPQIDIATSLIHQNTFFLNCYAGETFIIKVRGVVLANREALVLRHYVEQINALKVKYHNLRVTFAWHASSRQRLNVDEIDIDFGNCRIIYFGFCHDDGTPKSNLCIMQLPARIPECKSIKKFFCSEANHQKASTSCRLIEPGANNILSLRANYNANQPYMVEPTKDTRAVLMQRVYTYNYHGQGVCGSLLLADNLEQPIVGIHVAGSGIGSEGIGVAEPVSAEMVGIIPKQRLTWHENITQMPCDPIPEGDYDIDTITFPHGQVQPNLAQAQAMKTRIVPSAIHGVFPVRTAPNPLSPSDPRLPKGSNPLRDGCRKHGLLTKDFPTKVLEEAYVHLRDKMLANVKPIVQKVGKQSMQTAVCGDKSVPEFDAMNFKSSPGFPLNSEYSKRLWNTGKIGGKKWLFDLEGDEEGYILKKVHPELSRLINQTHQLRTKNIKPFTVFSDCLKDTTLPIEKNSIPGKTRIFSISPVQYTIPFRQYFGDFMGAYRRSRLAAEHGIGIDCNGPEWTRLAQHLSKFGPHIVTGDYKNFGPGLNLEVVTCALQIILDWYNKYENDFGKDNLVESPDERLRIRTIMLSELVGAIHLYGNKVYRVGAGIPSGSPITDILNSIVNKLYIRIIYKLITKLNINTFDDNVVLVVYGDDLIMNIHPDLIPVFNATTIGKAFKEFDIVFTDQDKQDNPIASRTLTDATFLKHGFAPHPTRNMQLLAPLDKVSIEGCANWVTIANDPIEAIKQNALACCELAYGCGPKYYDWIRSSLVSALQDKQIDCALPIWDNLDTRIWDQSEKFTINNDLIDN